MVCRDRQQCSDQTSRIDFGAGWTVCDGAAGVNTDQHFFFPPRPQAFSSAIKNRALGRGNDDCLHVLYPLLHRQRERERRAESFLAADRDFTAMRLDNLLRDGKP